MQRLLDKMAFQFTRVTLFALPAFGPVVASAQVPKRISGPVASLQEVAQKWQGVKRAAAAPSN